MPDEEPDPCTCENGKKEPVVSRWTFYVCANCGGKIE